jgi:beta-galactosidase GanA
VMLHPWSREFQEKLPDPFSPDFRQGVEKAVQETAGKEAKDPWCIGYFINNELKWVSPLALGKAALTHDVKKPAKMELIKQLKTKYTTIQNLNAAWETSCADWDALAGTRKEGKFNKAIEQDLEAFGNSFCDTFFRTIGEVMKQHAPGKLYLGDRFNKNVKEAISACARYADVVSFNKYEPGIESIQLPKGSVDKPMIIGEFCFVRGGRRHVSAGLGEVFAAAHTRNTS